MKAATLPPTPFEVCVVCHKDFSLFEDIILRYKTCCSKVCSDCMKKAMLASPSAAFGLVTCPNTDCRSVINTRYLCTELIDPEWEPPKRKRKPPSRELSTTDVQQPSHDPPSPLPMAARNGMLMVSGEKETPPYPSATALFTGPVCIVCLDERQRTTPRPCCGQPVCRSCMVQIVRLSINDGIAHIKCPNPECTKALTHEFIIDLTDNDGVLKEKYDRFLVDAESDGSKKTCPYCCFITEHRLPRKFRLKEEDVKLRCTSCDLEWCFKCHAPWHEGLTCRTYKKGDRQFQDWTKGKREAGDANCRQCPTCRVYIQRNEGCDHMTCNRCNSEFCYKCGGLYVDIPGFGDHQTKLSVFGCKAIVSGSAVFRKAVRGSYLTAKLACLTGYPFLFAGGVAVLLAAGIVVVPIYVGYRVYRYHKNTSIYKVNRRRH